MKQKLIKYNSYIILITSIIIFLLGFFFIKRTSYNVAKRNLIDYSLLLATHYESDNEEELANLIDKLNPHLNLTILSVEGEVLFNTGENKISYFELPAVKNKGKVFIRYSEEQNTKLMYYAQLYQEKIVLVSYPTPDISSQFISYLLILVIIFSIVLYFSSILIDKATHKFIEELNNSLQELSNLTNKKELSIVTDIEDINLQLDIIGLILKSNLSQLQEEKQKMDFLINSMHQGIVVLSNNKEVILINNFACALFNTTKEEALNNNFFWVSQNIKLLSTINLVIKQKTTKRVEFSIDGNIYSIEISQVKEQEDKYTIILVITDVTQIRNLDTSKREFFANASHELKSPLTSIMGFQEMITEGVITDKKELIEISKKTLIETKRAADLIQEMLHLSQLENINYSIKKEKVYLKEIILNTLDSLKPQISNMNLNITTKLSDCYFYANKDHMYKLVRNLIDNAIKYNNLNGDILITLKYNPEQRVELMVSDTGIGISKEHQKRIFERFFRVDKARSKSMGGTGLGLSIVKHICIIYNAKVEVESELGKRTTFKIIL